MSGPSEESRTPRFVVELTLDGEPLVLKGFIHDMLGGAVHGMISNLKGYRDCRRIEVTVRPFDDDDRSEDA